VRSAAESYRENLWATQLYHVEVWIEKEALLGVIEAICEHDFFGVFRVISMLTRQVGLRRELNFRRRRIIATAAMLACHPSKWATLDRAIMAYATCARKFRT
jgi:hypothetical protein